MAESTAATNPRSPSGEASAALSPGVEAGIGCGITEIGLVSMITASLCCRGLPRRRLGKTIKDHASIRDVVLPETQEAHELRAISVRHRIPELANNQVHREVHEDTLQEMPGEDHYHRRPSGRHH